MRVLFHVTILLIAYDAVHGTYPGPLQCRDENNQPVDWYVLYKLPKIKMSSNPLIRDGLSYLFITNGTIGNSWRLSTRSIGANNSIPANTLAPLYYYESNKTALWTLYNDQPPEAADAANRGHTKGVVAADSERGFWLVHSVPGFPPVPSAGVRTRPQKQENLTVAAGYEYPKAGTVYGQSFLCVSIGADYLNGVGKQLLYNEIAVYAKNLPESLAQKYPMLVNATRQKRIRDPPFTNKAVFKSLGDVQFTSFAKTGKWEKDLYADFIAPQLQADLYVQTWPRSPGALESSCGRRKIYNVKSLVFEGANVNYQNAFDHSKWAISLKERSSKLWVCIGDINRATTQFTRGGGAVCIQDERLWINYRDIVNDVHFCT